MRNRFLPVLCGTLAVAALPAAAQQSSHQSTPAQSASSSGASQSEQNTPAIQQHVKQDLEQAGFTQVQVLPQSFLVRAHDKKGRPVMMVINPDSVVAVTQTSSSGSSSGNNKNDSTTK